VGFEWFNEIDQVVYGFEGTVEQVAGAKMIGMAPSAGDEARSILRRRAGEDGSPRKMLEDVAKLTRGAVEATTEALAGAAVEAAMARGSRHVTREDVQTALADASYPWVKR